MTNLMRASHLSRLAQERKKDRLLTVRDLYPGMPDPWSTEAEATFRRFLAHALAMYERLSETPDAAAALQALTPSQQRAGIERKRSTPHIGELSPPRP